LINQGILLDDIAQLKAECVWGESDFRPYQIQLSESKALLVKTQSELCHIQSQLSHAQSQLAHTQSELAHTQSELAHAQSELAHAQSELAHAQSELSQTQALLRHSENKVKELFSSTSWRLASPLRRLKSLITGGK
jgi:peptidoglycan hydrolase CwlO-like protein